MPPEGWGKGMYHNTRPNFTFGFFFDKYLSMANLSVFGGFYISDTESKYNSAIIRKDP